MAENFFNDRGAFGEPRLIFFFDRLVPHCLSTIQLDVKQFSKQSVAMRSRDALEVITEIRLFFGTPSRFELVATLVDLQEDG
jgi:hypothetical protein